LLHVDGADFLAGGAAVAEHAVGGPGRGPARGRGADGAAAGTAAGGLMEPLAGRASDGLARPANGPTSPVCFLPIAYTHANSCSRFPLSLDVSFPTFSDLLPQRGAWHLEECLLL